MPLFGKKKKEKQEEVSPIAAVYSDKKIPGITVERGRFFTHDIPAPAKKHLPEEQLAETKVKLIELCLLFDQGKLTQEAFDARFYVTLKTGFPMEWYQDPNVQEFMNQPPPGNNVNIMLLYSTASLIAHQRIIAERIRQ